MDAITLSTLKKLAKQRTGPCVSIFMPTRPGGSDDDVSNFKERLHEAERQLRSVGWADDEIERLLKSGQKLLSAGERAWWNRSNQGIAVFIAPKFQVAFQLPAAFETAVFVGPRFQLLPLLPLIAQVGRCFILALSQGRVRLLAASKHTVDEVAVAGLPANRAESRRRHDRDEPLNLHTRRMGSGRSVATFHGQGVGIDDEKSELTQYCRSVERPIRKALAGHREPLVLAAVKGLAAIYRQVSTYEHLLPETVFGNPDRMSNARLRDKAWEFVAPRVLAQTQHIVERYRELAGTGRTTEQLDELLSASRRGELETVIVDANREVWGRYDPDSDSVELLRRYRPGAEGLVNLAAIHALLRDRTLVVADSTSDRAPPARGIHFTPRNKHGK